MRVGTVCAVLCTCMSMCICACIWVCMCVTVSVCKCVSARMCVCICTNIHKCTYSVKHYELPWDKTLHDLSLLLLSCRLTLSILEYMYYLAELPWNKALYNYSLLSSHSQYIRVHVLPCRAPLKQSTVQLLIIIVISLLVYQCTCTTLHCFGLELSLIHIWRCRR